MTKHSPSSLFTETAYIHSVLAKASESFNGKSAASKMDRKEKRGCTNAELEAGHRQSLVPCPAVGAVIRWRQSNYVFLEMSNFHMGEPARMDVQ